MTMGATPAYLRARAGQDAQVIARKKHRPVIARSGATKQSRSDVRAAARDCFAALAMTRQNNCHCEERSDEAISIG
jgi:hypothetical protein